jgi:3-hydroxybutyryl-CoA dehydratase
MAYSGCTYADATIGRVFSSTKLVTEADIAQACHLTGDFNPLHADADYAAQTRFGGIILHGPVTAGMMGAVIGNSFAGTAIAYLEQNVRFTAPVKPGDTLTTHWKVTAREDKPQHGGGVLTLQGECHNQQGEMVAAGTGKLLTSNSALPQSGAALATGGPHG